MRTLTTPRALAYAAGGLGISLTNLVISQWVFKRYVPTPADALLPVALFSAIFLLGRITDAVTDPMIAYWSDRLQSRAGRRIPFLRAAMIPLAVVFLLIWMPPEDAAPWVIFVFAAVLIQAYFVLYTAMATPYLALLPEIAKGHRERVNVATYQAVFMLIGTAVFGIVGVVIEGAGWIAMGGMVSVLILVSFGPTVLAIREDPPPPPDPGAPRANLLRWIGLTFRNRPFLHLVSSTALFWFGLNLLIMLVPYWVQDHLGHGEGEVTLAMGPFLGSTALFFVGFNALAKRAGNYRAYLVAVAGTAVVVPGFALVGWLPWGSPLLQTAVVMGLIGVPVAGFMMLPYALMAEVVDHDEQLTGQRREAIYFGVQAIFQKTLIGLSMVVFGWMALSGGDEVRVVGLKAIPWVSSVFFVAGLLAFLGYPLRPGRGER